VDDNESVNLLGVRVCTLPVESLVSFITRTIHLGDKARIAYVNVHAINLAQELAWFRDFLNSSDVAWCDGFGVKWGARLLGLRIRYRYVLTDWITLLASECAREHFSLYLLGARPGLAERAGVSLKQQFSDLNITGFQHGFFEKSPGSKENEGVLQAINAAQPDILLVGLGMPLQERWLMENWDRLRIRVAIPVGALFDYLYGETLRAPRWMNDHGLEWLGRLIIEPRRLWRRYLLGNPRFIWLLVKQGLGMRRTG